MVVKNDMLSINKSYAHWSKCKYSAAFSTWQDHTTTVQMQYRLLNRAIKMYRNQGLGRAWCTWRELNQIIAYNSPGNQAQMLKALNNQADEIHDLQKALLKSQEEITILESRLKRFEEEASNITTPPLTIDASTSTDLNVDASTSTDLNIDASTSSVSSRLEIDCSTRTPKRRSIQMNSKKRGLKNNDKLFDMSELNSFMLSRQEKESHERAERLLATAILPYSPQKVGETIAALLEDGFENMDVEENIIDHMGVMSQQKGSPLAYG